MSEDQVFETFLSIMFNTFTEDELAYSVIVAKAENKWTEANKDVFSSDG